MGSIMGLKWEVYNFNNELVKTRIPQKGEVVVIKNTPFMVDAGLQLVGDGVKTIEQLYEHFDNRYKSFGGELDGLKIMFLNLQGEFNTLQERQDGLQYLVEYLRSFIESKFGPLNAVVPLVIEGGDYLIIENDDYLVVA